MYNTFWFAMEGNWVFKVLYQNQSLPPQPCSWSLTWISVVISYLVFPLWASCSDSTVFLSEWLFKTTMAFLCGKRFKGNPLLLEYGPTAWLYARTFVVPSLPISLAPPLTDMLPHSLCLIFQPHGSGTPPSHQRPDLMTYPFILA